VNKPPLDTPVNERVDIAELLVRYRELFVTAAGFEHSPASAAADDPTFEASALCSPRGAFRSPRISADDRKVIVDPLRLLLKRQNDELDLGPHGELRLFAQTWLKPSRFGRRPPQAARAEAFDAAGRVLAFVRDTATRRQRSAPSTSDAATERVDADCERIVNVIRAKPATARTQEQLRRWVNAEGANHGAQPMTRDTLRRRLVKIRKSGAVPVSRLPKLGMRAAE